MKSPKPNHANFDALLVDIKKGAIKIPQFQRKFVWDRAMSATLLDSILKGYPLGTLILWKTKERLRAVRNIGGDDLPDAPEGDYVFQVLDGQQRLTSLYAALKGLKPNNEDFGEICVDLDADPEGDEPLVYSSPDEAPKDHAHIWFKDLRDRTSRELQKSGYTDAQLDRMDLLKRRLETYQFPTVEIEDAPLDVATEIFTRLNVGGKRLSVFEIMVAKTWDENSGFDLLEKTEQIDKVLTVRGYGGLDPAMLMQTTAAIVCQCVTARDILNINKKRFIEAWQETETALLQAVDFCHSDLRIPVRALLPYPRVLIPLAYYFYLAKRNPAGETKARIVDLVFRIGLSERYSTAPEAKIAQDLKAVQEIHANRAPIYDYGVDVSPDFILRNGYFRAGKAFINSLLCILAAEHPHNFDTDGNVILGNALLKGRNSKNYHHFFPMDFMKKNPSEKYQPNHIGNITLIGADLNKNLIRAKPPGVYIRSFMAGNEKMQASLATHLIDLKTMGVLENNYDTFLPERCKKLSAAIAERLLPQAMDAKAPLELAPSINEPEDKLEVDDDLSDSQIA